MLPFAHMGIGSRLVKPWAHGLPTWALLAGTLLPDIIDKPLFYIMLWRSHASGTPLGLIDSTRTFGHTALFLVVIALAAFVRRTRVLAALALGVATHLLLDNVSDALAAYFMTGAIDSGPRSAMVALLYPFYRPDFPPAPFDSLKGHAERSVRPLSLGLEVAGATILFWDRWQWRNGPEIVKRGRKRLRRSGV